MRIAFLLMLMLLALPATADDFEHFPYPVVEVTGAEAEAEWHRLRSEPGTPIIIGGYEDATNLADTFGPEWAEFYTQTPEEILQAAKDLSFPQGLYDLRAEGHARYVAWMKQEGYELDGPEVFDPVAIAEMDMGRWPFFYTPPQRIIGLDNWQTDRPVDIAYIAILPTENPWEAPAYLRYGGWNENPPPEIHVAALRQWYQDFGAEPALIAFDTMELWAPGRPTDQSLARDLAITQLQYNSDVVYQGVGTVARLAADRMRAPYWYFWWD